MPKFHDRTRRKICLAAFVAICIVPTVGMLAWGVSRQSSWHVDACARRLSRQLALDVTIDRVEHPRPGVVRYLGVRISDPETDETICVCRRIKAFRQDVSDATRSALVLNIDEPELRPRRAGQFWQLLQRVMARRMSGDDVDVRLVAKRLVLRTDTDEDLAVLGKVSASLQTGDGGGRAEFKFQIGEPVADNTDPRRPVKITVSRDRKAAPPEFSFYVNAQAEPLPCSLMGLFIPECKTLGPDSRFKGYLSAQHGPQGWSGQVVDARLTGVDLAQCFQPQFPDVLAGQATLTLQQANFSHGRLQNAAGSITAGPGTISRVFFDNASEPLQLRPLPLPENAPDQLPYEILSLDFNVDHTGLQIHGTVADHPAADPTVPIILANTEGPLLSEPVTQPLPPSSLLHALVPDPHKRTAWLSRWLPLSEPAVNLETQ